MEPTALATGAASPVMEASFTSPAPETTVPSTGSTAPLPMWSTWPWRTSEMGMRTSVPSSATSQAVSARATMPSRRARRARACTCSSMRSDTVRRNMTVEASEKLPRAREATMAEASSTSTVSWPRSRRERPASTKGTARAMAQATLSGAGRRSLRAT